MRRNMIVFGAFPPPNVYAVHKECAAEKHAEFQQKYGHLEYKPGDFAKTAFVDGENTEHMWVKITGVAGEEMSGLLWNDPGQVKNVRFQTEVTFKRSEIEAAIIDDKEYR